MPKASPLQPSFTAGEFSPRLYGRTDSERYKTGLATCLNYLPTIEGPIIRRPGTKYSGFDVRDPSIPPVLIPFEASQTDTFMLEFGDKYIRFFKNGGALVTINSAVVRSNADYLAGAPSSGSDGYSSYSVDNTVPVSVGSTAVGQPLELPSPFNSSHLSQLRTSFQGGELYITCPDFPPYKLSRANDYKWSIAPLWPLLDGPYLPFNSDQTSGDRYNVSIVPTIVGTSLFNKVATVTALTNKFVVSNAVRLWGENSSYIYVAMSTVASHNFYLGQRVIGDSTGNGAGFAFGPSDGIMSGDIFGISNDRELRVYDNAFFTLGVAGGNGSVISSTFIHPALVSETCYNRLMAFSNAGKRYWGSITTILASSAHQFTIKIRETPLPNANTISSWQLGSFYETQSIDANNKIVSYWPRFNTFHQSRWILSGNAKSPQEVYGSVVNEFLEFRSSNSSYVVSDVNALQFIIASKNQNSIKWLASDSNALLAGGASSEFKISPSSQATALTPSNINASETSFFGSEDVTPVQTGNATLYVQRAGRKIRELNYFFQFNSYKSTDLTQLSNHITSPSVIEMEDVKETIPAVWGLRSDGQLISMVYGRDDETLKAGWARHELGGQSDSGGSAPKVLSMAVIAGSAATFDQLWMCTKRFINGTSVVNIEYMTKPFEDDSNLEDAIFLDCAGTYDNPKAITNISIAGSSIVTAPSHGFSNGDEVQITKVVGLNTSVVDINGYEFNSNRVNYGIFRVGSTATNTFFLTDINNGSSYIDTRGYSVYVSGGEVRKKISTISGLTWLKNEVVGILADGRVHPDTQVNSAGVLALSFSAAKVQVGLKYNSDGETLRADAGSGDGTSVGKLRRPARAAFLLHNIGEISVGMSFTNMVPMSDVEQFKADYSNADLMTPLFSGIARESLESQHDYDGQICFRQSAPLPGMVQSITPFIEENDV